EWRDHRVAERQRIHPFRSPADRVARIWTAIRSNTPASPAPSTSARPAIRAGDGIWPTNPCWPATYSTWWRVALRTRRIGRERSGQPLVPANPFVQLEPLRSRRQQIENVLRRKSRIARIQRFVDPPHEFEVL